MKSLYCHWLVASIVLGLYVVIDRAPMQKTLRLDGVGRDYNSSQTHLLYFPFHECLMTRKEHISSAASVGEALPELQEENMTTKTQSSNFNQADWRKL